MFSYVLPIISIFFCFSLISLFTDSSLRLLVVFDVSHIFIVIYALSDLHFSMSLLFSLLCLLSCFSMFSYLHVFFLLTMMLLFSCLCQFLCLIFFFYVLPVAFPVHHLVVWPLCSMYLSPLPSSSNVFSPTISWTCSLCASCSLCSHLFLHSALCSSCSLYFPNCIYSHSSTCFQFLMFALLSVLFKFFSFCPCSPSFPCFMSSFCSLFCIFCRLFSLLSLFLYFPCSPWQISSSVFCCFLSLCFPCPHIFVKF